MDLAIAAHGNDSLIDQLSFQLPEQSTYARERRLVSIQPTGANNFSPQGNTVATFSLTSQDSWLDPSSLRLQFRIRNTAAVEADTGLIPAGGCHCFWSQLRILVGGTEIERLEPYNMLHELFRVALASPASQVEQAVEDGREYNAAAYPPVAPARIAPGTYRTVCLTLCCGTLSCGKYLPLRLLNSFQIELTCARPDEALAPAGGTNYSRQYELSGCKLFYSIVRLDSALEQGFSSLLLQGRALQLNLKTVMTQNSISPAGATEHQATVSRALSRIAAVFVSFQGRDAANSSILRFHNPSAVLPGGERTLEWMLQVGSKTWPESQTCESTSASMSLLRQALGIYDQTVVSTSITPANYFANRYILGVPTSTIPNQSFSGTSTRSGDLLSVILKGLSGVANEQAQKVYVSIVAEVILEIKESGTILLE